LLGQTAQEFRLCIPGLNQAQAEIQAFLGHDLWSILSEIFCHETSLKYLSNHMAKPQVKNPLELLLTGQKYKRNPLYPVLSTRLYLAVLLVWQLANLFN